MKLDTIGEKVKYLRFKSNLTRRDMENNYGFPSRKLRSIEDNLKRTTDDELRHLINIFSKRGTNIELDWFKQKETDVCLAFKSKLESFSHLDCLSQETSNFIAFINNKKQTSYISNNWNKCFKPVTMVNGCIIKLLGSQIEPYVDKVLSGDNVKFRYKDPTNKYLTIRFVSYIKKKKISGFYIFVEE